MPEVWPPHILGVCTTSDVPNTHDRHVVVKREMHGLISRNGMMKQRCLQVGGRSGPGTEVSPVLDEVALPLKGETRFIGLECCWTQGLLLDKSVTVVARGISHQLRLVSHVQPFLDKKRSCHCGAPPGNI